MKKTLLLPDQEISPSLTASVNSSCNEMIWENGVSISQDDYNLSNLEFFCESLPKGYFPDYAVSDTGCSVVSKRFKTFLEDMGIDNIQYFPATIIENVDEPVKEGYFVANIVGVLDCIDKNLSIMDMDQDEGNIMIWSIDQLVLMENMHTSDKIFRAKYFTRIILVDELFKEAFKLTEMEGIKLISPERWDGYNGER
ncbi:hypothetical protein M0D21_08150 [Aquimarina sp. D1M17]|uniref:imm11 family protein n=1 Tax=Aquimarina acroporae TaxID=2937283 RepID=UPI0020BF8431|nr:DUF1629 domain-containing protein [Aquimarina acroporae]MCK8521536.1 hypothetical protein [Aquimarina acroporae]